MRNGIVEENGQKIYYKDDKPYHAGVVKIDGDIYYVGRNGKVATGQHVVHGEMSNGILKRGTYTFSQEGKLIKGSYIPAKMKRRKHHKQNKKRIMFNSKKTLGVCIGLVAVFVVLLVIGIISDREKTPASTENENSVVAVDIPEVNEPISLCSPLAEKLYLGECDFDDVTGDKPYRAFEFDYSIKGTNGEFYLSEHPDMNHKRCFTLSQYKDKLTIDNLKTGCTYYYEVRAKDEKITGSFATAEGTRFVDIPGTDNTRDIGGYVNKDGKTVRQGMIIRGAELDGLTDADYYLSNSDADTVMNQFGFVYEMDLRSSSVSDENYTSKLSENVKHQFYSAPMYGKVFSPAYKDSLRRIFSDLAEPENYPMYMHCTYGADQTGTVVFLLHGILGLEDEDIMREYRLTTFVNENFAETDRILAITDGLEEYKGDTLSERIEDFLINDIGVTQSEIDSIRSILLEK